jgi:hypothetical protein
MYYKPVNPRGEGLYDIISTVTTVPSTVSLGMAGVWEGNTLCLPSFSVGGGRRANRNSHHCEAILLDRIRTLRRGCSYCFRGHWTFLKSQELLCHSYCPPFCGCMIICTAPSDRRQFNTSEYRLLFHRTGLRQVHCSFVGSDHQGKACHARSLLLHGK